MQETQSNPRSVADVIESIGRMMKAKELAPLIAHDVKTLYAKAAAGTIPSVKLAGSLCFDSYVKGFLGRGYCTWFKFLCCTPCFPASVSRCHWSAFAFVSEPITPYSWLGM